VVAFLRRRKPASNPIDIAPLLHYNPHMDIRTVVSEFTNKLVATIERQVIDRAKQAVSAAFNGTGHAPRRRGRPPKAVAAPRVTTIGRPRKKSPRQLCPVPGCKNSAAPVFGMVCAQHKNVAKTKIKKYREARKAAKAAA
jgi:hypothetical protein